MNKIAKDLEQIIEKSTDPSLFPVQKGRKILVGSRKIIEGDDGFTVFENKRPLLKTYTKIAALAAARSNANRHPEILRLDRLIDKKASDCVFYEAAGENSKEKNTLSILMHDSRMHIKDCREKLESFIFRQAK